MCKNPNITPFSSLCPLPQNIIHTELGKTITSHQFCVANDLKSTVKTQSPPRISKPGYETQAVTTAMSVVQKTLAEYEMADINVRKIMEQVHYNYVTAM